MTPPVITFFNNKGGVGKTSLVYHVAWMLADLDPQANLTAAFLEEEEVEELWNSAEPRTIWSAIRPFVDEGGAIRPVMTTPTDDERLALLPGDLSLSRFEDELSRQWHECDGERLHPYLVTSAFWTVLRSVAQRHQADVVLVDVGPSLGAINRAALVASDHVVVPVAPDPFSLQGLRNLGPTLRGWRGRWQEMLKALDDRSRPLPAGAMAPLGYIVLGRGVRLSRPVPAYQRWTARIPRTSTMPCSASRGRLPRPTRTASPSSSTTTASCHSPRRQGSRCSR